MVFESPNFVTVTNKVSTYPVLGPPESTLETSHRVSVFNVTAGPI